ncbi:hypothetical protein BBJ28_00024658 [Nothophytophthora sp. Chile5]|nr:hypothetical protein BBJ28_00024658 [Nothophytophthora sp. Chile5]
MVSHTSPPLATVTLVLREKPAVAALPHVIELLSLCLDCSADLPLPRACSLGSIELLERIWNFSLSSNWSRSWCISMFLQSNAHYKRAQFSPSLAQAAGSGNLAVVQWLFAHFSECVAGIDVVEAAAGAGEMRILQFLLANDSSWTPTDAGGESVGMENNEWRRNGNEVWWGRNDMAVAAKNGHGQVARWLYERTADIERDLEEILACAVESGDLSLVQWLMVNGFAEEALYPPIAVAALSGHLPLMQWLDEQGYPPDEDAFASPMEPPLDNLKVLQYMVDNEMVSVSETFGKACGDGDLPVVWWLAEKIEQDAVTLERFDAHSAMENAASVGRLELVQWLVERRIGTFSCKAEHLAVANGHLEIAKYLHAHGLSGCSQDTMRAAASGGWLEVVKWLWETFADDPDVDLFCEMWNDRIEDVSPPSAMEEAAANGHLPVLEFLHGVALSMERRKRKRESERSGDTAKTKPQCSVGAMDRAAAGGHLSVVQWLYEHRTEGYTEVAILKAVERGDLAMIQWLYSHPNGTFTSWNMDQAAANGHLAAVQWLHEAGVSCSTLAMNRAASNGHLAVVRWLHTHRTEGCTSNAMNYAAPNGHLHVVQWLHAHRSEGGSISGIIDTAYKGRLEVLLFLGLHHRYDGNLVNNIAIDSGVPWLEAYCPRI